MKKLASLALAALLCACVPLSVFAADTAVPADQVDWAEALLLDINESREADIALNDALCQMTLTYATQMYDAGRDFRDTTDYLTLPSGEKVFSLMDGCGYEGRIKNFGYTVWVNRVAQGEEALTALTETVKQSNRYTEKVVEGDINQIGITAFTSDNSTDKYSAIAMVYLNND